MDPQRAEHGAKWIVAQAEHVITRFPRRAPGSEGEAVTQQYFESVLKTVTAEYNVHSERFTVHPHAFMGFIPVCMTLQLFAIALFWLELSWTSWLVSHLAWPIVVLEFGLYRQLIDPFFPSRHSTNVYAIIPPKGDAPPSRRIIVGGHSDAAFIWNFNRWHPIVLWTAFITIIIGCLSVAFTTWLPQPLFGFHGRYSLVPIILHSLAIFSSILAFTATNFFTPAPGANDNLSGALTAIDTGTFFSQIENKLENTELWILITGSEESGLRGAKAFLKEHRASLSSVSHTSFIALECLRQEDHLEVVTKDLNGLRNSDRELIHLLNSAHYQAFGAGTVKPLRTEVLFCGASDAAAFLESGIPSVCMAAMDPGPPQYYHTALDTYTNMSPVCLSRALQILTHAIKLFDSSPSPLGPPMKPWCHSISPAKEEERHLIISHS